MKTFTTRGNKTRRERVNFNPNKINNFSICAFSIQNDININLLFRSLANFAGKEMFIIGSKKWHKGATNGLEDIISVIYFKDFQEFKFHIKNNTNYSIIAIEQC